MAKNEMKNMIENKPETEHKSTKKKKTPKLNLSDKMPLTFGGKVLLGVNYLLLILWVLAILVPLFLMVKSAFNGNQSTRLNMSAPFVFSTKHFEHLFKETQFLLWVKNTIFIAVATALLTLLFVSFTGYAYSRFRFKGRKASLMTIMLLQTIPAFAGITAYFTIYTLISSKMPVFSRQMMLILIYSGGGIAGNTFILKGYLDSISTELDDAAKIDGLSYIQIYRLIIMPIAKPMLAIIALWSFIGPFMDYLLPLVLLNSPADYTLAPGLFYLISDVRNMNEPAFAAGGLLTALPIVILFTALQKQLVSGLASGAVK